MTATMKNMNENIEQAIYELRTNSPRYQKTESYYRGEHQLAFASEKFRNTFGSLFREFAMNLCPAVCDSVRDKLIVTGFTVDEDGVDREPPRPPENGGHLAPRVRREFRVVLVRSYSSYSVAQFSGNH